MCALAGTYHSQVLSVMLCVAMCCSALHCVARCCSAYVHTNARSIVSHHECCLVMSVLQCDALCCSVV